MDRVPGILCMEGDANVAACLERMLRCLGYGTTVVGTVRDGLRALSERPHDLVICNHAMPDAHGIELIHALREQCRDIPIILTADYGEVDEAVRSIELGAADYLTTPLRAESLRLAVKGAIERNRLRHEIAPASGSASGDPTVELRAVEHATIQRALRLTGGNRTRAARMLGISERTLRNKLNT